MMRLIVFVAVTALLGVVPACASPATGISYDEVVKFTNGDAASSLKTGDFDSDFQTASRPKPRPTFGPILTSMTATRHYIAWPKERLEEPPGQGALITDCDARTSTFLNFKNKTYTVTPVPPQPRPPRATLQCRCEAAIGVALRSLAAYDSPHHCQSRLVYGTTRIVSVL